MDLQQTQKTDKRSQQYSLGEKFKDEEIIDNNYLENEIQSPFIKKKNEQQVQIPLIEIHDIQVQNQNYAINQLVYGIKVIVFFQKSRKIENVKTKQYYTTGNLSLSSESQQELIFLDDVVVVEDNKPTQYSLKKQLEVINMFTIKSVESSYPNWKLPSIKNTKIESSPNHYLIINFFKVHSSVAIYFYSPAERDLIWFSFQKIYIDQHRRLNTMGKEKIKDIFTLIKQIDNDNQELYNISDINEMLRKFDIRINKQQLQQKIIQFLKTINKFTQYRESRNSIRINKNDADSISIERMESEDVKKLCIFFCNRKEFQHLYQLYSNQITEEEQRNSNLIEQKSSTINYSNKNLQLNLDKGSHVNLDQINNKKDNGVDQKPANKKYIFDPLAHSLTKENFIQFCLKEQEESLESNSNLYLEIDQIFQQLSPYQSTAINYMDFIKYIFSPKNSIIDSKKCQIYQNMKLPITDYYINSARQIYSSSVDFTKIYELSEEQNILWETSSSKYLPLFYSLYKGVRYMEIEVWEGEFEIYDKNNNKNSIIEPCILYGATMNSKLNLKDFLNKLEQTVFLLSKFPFFLHITSHCSQDINFKIKLIIKSILKNKLYRIPEDYQNLQTYPSPFELQFKIIILGNINIDNLQIQEKLKNQDQFQSIKQDLVDIDLFELFQDEENVEIQMQDQLKYLKTVNKFMKKPKLKSTLEKKYIKGEIVKTLNQDSKQPQTTNRSQKHLKVLNNNNANLLKKPLNDDNNNLDNSFIQENDIEDYEIDDYSPDKIKKDQMQKQKDQNEILQNINSPRSNSILQNKSQINKHFDTFNLKANVLDISNYLKEDDFTQLYSFFNIQFHATSFPSMWEFYSITYNQLIDHISNHNLASKNFQNTAAQGYPNLQLFAKNYLLKVQPSGKKIDMLNQYNPLNLGFSQGAQFVLNHPQTFDINSLLYYSKFMENGHYKSGYVLKPEHLRSNSLSAINSPSCNSFQLEFTLICGYKLPLPKNQEIVSPGVEIIFHSPNLEESQKTFKTHVAYNQTYDPQFNLKFSIFISHPEISFLVFKVINSQQGDLLGWNSIPINLMRNGYRSIPLRDQYFNHISDSYLLCKCSGIPQL